MCVAPLSLIKPIRIEEDSVVKKSYPNFWKDLENIGFEIEYL
jgi:3-phosphoshikimate 1-carboxyvinyltransferase